MKPSSLVGAAVAAVVAMSSSAFAALVEIGVDRNAIPPEIDWDRNARRSGLLAVYATADPTIKPDASKTVYLRFILVQAGCIGTKRLGVTARMNEGGNDIFVGVIERKIGSADRVPTVCPPSTLVLPELVPGVL
jgi:hypothetical protein